MAVKRKPIEPVHDRDRIIIRLPDGMRDKLSQLADANGRSMTAEVVAALEEHLTRPDRLAAVEGFIERHRKLIEGLEDFGDWLTGDLGRDLERLQSKVDEIDERTGRTRY